MLVLACPNCPYGTLQAGNDPEAIELGDLQAIHNKTFKHDAEIREATTDDIVRYSKKKEKS